MAMTGAGTNSAQPPLSGIRVLDMSRILAGPWFGNAMFNGFASGISGMFGSDVDPNRIIPYLQRSGWAALGPPPPNKHTIGDTRGGGMGGKVRSFGKWHAPLVLLPSPHRGERSKD
jgi:hypothetical protein